MWTARAKLTIAVLSASLYHAGALAADPAAVPASAVNLSSAAPEAVPPESMNALSAATTTEDAPPESSATPTPPNVNDTHTEASTTPAAASTPEAKTPSEKSATDAPSATAPAQAAILSIDPAPSNAAAPALKAADKLDDTQHDLWARIRAGFGLPALDTALVKENEDWYTSRPEYVARMLARSKRYLFYIVQQVEKRGMPTEIALLPMIESAFNPNAYSRSHAAGIWQFIPSTGRNYGLKQNWWVDNRRNVIAATNAALDYLQNLHDMFGDWELALAAYNWGEGSVAHAIARNQAKGLPTDYLSLHMPKETQSYVPRLIAVKNLIQHPHAFGIDLGVVPNTPYFTQITLTQHMDVALAAKLAETPLKEFTSLNPNYNRPVIQAKQPITLLLPVDKAEIFASNLENYSKPLVSWQPYYAKRGEKLASIARRHGISGVRLKEANGITLRRGRLTRNQVLLVPGKDGAKLETASFNTLAAASESRLHEKLYTVHRGDTLLSIAQHTGVKVQQIKAWNRIRSNRIRINQKLHLGPVEKTLHHTRVASAKTAHRTTIAYRAPTHKRYTVRRGDTLSSIAQHFDVALHDLVRWNKLSSKKRLHPGDKVLILAKND